MASGPLADALAVAMLGVACFHASRLVLAMLWRRPTELDVDVVHAVMGVSMAGMLTGWLTGAWDDAWIVVFAASTAWFGRGVVRHLSDARGSGDAITHHLPHFVVSSVMLYMLWAMRWTSMSGAQMSAAGRASGSLLLPCVFAALVVGNAAIAAWRALFWAPAAAVTVEAVPSTPSTAKPVGMIGLRGAPACFVVMSMAMAYMVVTVHP